MIDAANEIFFDTLEQYTHDATAGAAVRAAIADALTHSPDLIESAAKDAQTNLRWFSARPKKERVQIMALAAAVQRYKAQHGERAEQTQAPAAARLDCLELATALYRYLKKYKKAVDHVVEQTTIQTRAAYAAIVRSNLQLITQCRQRKATRNWSRIADIIKAATGKTIPAATLSKVYADVLAKQAAGGSVAPAVMTHWENERIDPETAAAYEKAGYDMNPPHFEEGSA